MWSKAFWQDAAERAAKTAAQFGLVSIGGDVVTAWSLDWIQIGGVMVAGAAVSLLTSIASAGVGVKGSASLLTGDQS